MSEPRTVDCEQVVRLLLAYLDGEVSENERGEVDRHLALCRSCFSRAEFEKRLRSHLVDLRLGVVPTEFEQRIRLLMSRFA